MKLKIRHSTKYKYAGEVSHSVNQLCLIPRSTLSQQRLNNHLTVVPTPAKIYFYEDGFGNPMANYTIEENHDYCEVESTSLVETSMFEQTITPNGIGIDQIKESLKADRTQDGLLASKCLLPSQNVQALTGTGTAVDNLLKQNSSVNGFAENLMRWIFEEFEYDPSFSTVVTTSQKVWDAKRGVCQDFAHLALSILREVGIPARYVSGYLETLPPPGQKKLEGSDASHAWYSVYTPDDGWVDFDPTNNQRPDYRYVTTAWGRDYGDVAPLKGVVYGGGSQSVSVSVDVNRVDGSMFTVDENTSTSNQ